MNNSCFFTAEDAEFAEENQIDNFCDLRVLCG
jgi:hypothetical protein